MKVEDAKALIDYARKSVEAGFEKKRFLPKQVPKSLKEKGGAFVTITAHPSHELRGCVGIVSADFPVFETVIKVARSAAFEDPRFPPLRREEVDNVIFELSVLSKPKKISARGKDILKSIRVGRDGLIVKMGFLAQGLLLPQVAVDQGWDEEEFLSSTCVKAGLPPDSWFDPRVEVFSFFAEVFKEESPKGKVTRVSLG